MNKRIMTIITTAVLVTAVGSIESFAGRGGGGGYGRQNGTCVRQMTTATVMQQTQVNRPADSRRRDGTFLTTGTTANGSTTRPGTGQRLRDGSCLTTTTTPTEPAPQ